MDFEKLAFLGSLLFVSSCASMTEKDMSSENESFEKYAAAICFGSAFDSDAVKADFNKAANGFMEQGNMPLEAYEELRLLVKGWLQKDYPSKHGGQVQSAKCFDLIDSAELQLLFETYNPCSSREDWLSETDYNRACL